MAKVSMVIKEVLRRKEAGLVEGSDAMLRILKNLHDQIMTELGKAALGSWDAYHLRQVLDQIEYQMAHYQGLAGHELSSLLDKAWAIGKDVVDKPLGLTGVYTGFHLDTKVLDALKEYSSNYLKSMFKDAWYGVKGEISLGVLGEKTPADVAKAIGTSIDKGRFANIANRAETITKTEMGTVFSKATQNRMAQAAKEVPGLEKEWLHAGHPRAPRPAHVRADGQHVPVADPFNVGGVKMMHPRDMSAPLEEIINCGCDHVPYHANWQ